MESAFISHLFRGIVTPKAFVIFNFETCCLDFRISDVHSLIRVPKINLSNLNPFIANVFMHDDSVEYSDKSIAHFCSSSCVTHHSFMVSLYYVDLLATHWSLSFSIYDYFDPLYLSNFFTKILGHVRLY